MDEGTNGKKTNENAAGKGESPNVRQRSTSYPRYDLPYVEKFVRTIFDEGARHCDLETVVKKIGYSTSNSGSVRALKATANQFGMISSQGDYISVSEPWIITLKSEDATELSRSRLEAMSAPELYKMIIETYKDRQLPTVDRLAKELYLTQKYGITQDAAKPAAQIFIDSAKHAGMIDIKGFLRIELNSSNSHKVPDVTTVDYTDVQEAPKGAREAVQGQEPRVSNPWAIPEEGLDRLEVQLMGGKRAYIFIPSPISAKDKNRLKQYIDLLLDEEDVSGTM